MLLSYSSSDDDYDNDHDQRSNNYHASAVASQSSSTLLHEDATNITLHAAQQFRSRHAARQEKANYFKKSEHLKQQRSNLERDLRLQFFDTKTPELRHAAAQASTEARQLDGTYQKEARTLSTRLIEFRNETGRLRCQLNRLVQDQTTTDNDSKGQELRPDEINSLHTTFDHLESDIASFKRHGRSRYQELQQQERSLVEDLEEFQKRSARWDMDNTTEILRQVSRFSTPPSKVSSRSHSSASSSSSSSSLSQRRSTTSTTRPTAVVNAEKAIQEAGGKNGGWDERDHATFLRLLSRYNLRTDVPTTATTTTTAAAARSSASSPGTAIGPTSSPEEKQNRNRRVHSMLKYGQEKKLPHLDVAELKKHWRWYQKYTSLVAEKREAVRQWRTKRAEAPQKTPERATKNMQQQHHGTGSPNSPSSSFRTPEQLRSARAQRKAETQQRLRVESERKKKELVAWKAQREKQRLLQEQEKEEELQQVKRKRNMEQEKKQRKKEEIAMYRLQREAEDAHQKAVEKVLATARGHLRGPPTSSTTLRARHERDMRKILEKKEKKEIEEKMKKMKEKKRLDITRNVNKRVVADFSRLTRHTTASAHNSLTPEELDDLETRRRVTHGGHNANLFGHTGAELSRGKTYGMSKASSLKVPSWRKIAR